MSENLKKVQEMRIERTIEALKENGINGYKVKNKEELKELIESLIESKSTVTVGGSMTLFESGIIDLLRNGDYNFLDRYKEGLSREDIEKIYRDAFFSDYYLTSTNALTEKGELYNVDGNGNRVAAMIFGPKKVIVVVGVNKLVKNLDEAIIRMIQMVVDNGHKEGCWVGICGELGADITMTERFVKMGVDELSVSPSMILPIREKIRNM